MSPVNSMQALSRKLFTRDAREPSTTSQLAAFIMQALLPKVESSASLADHIKHLLEMIVPKSASDNEFDLALGNLARAIFDFPVQVSKNQRECLGEAIARLTTLPSARQIK